MDNIKITGKINQKNKASWNTELSTFVENCQIGRSVFEQVHLDWLIDCKNKLRNVQFYKPKKIEGGSHNSCYVHC